MWITRVLNSIVGLLGGSEPERVARAANWSAEPTGGAAQHHRTHQAVPGDQISLFSRRCCKQCQYQVWGFICSVQGAINSASIRISSVQGSINSASIRLRDFSVQYKAVQTVPVLGDQVTRFNCQNKIVQKVPVPGEKIELLRTRRMKQCEYQVIKHIQCKALQILPQFYHYASQVPRYLEIHNEVQISQSDTFICTKKNEVSCVTARQLSLSICLSSCKCCLAGQFNAKRIEVVWLII